MDADYTLLEWAWQDEKNHLAGVSSGLAAAARTGNLTLITEWADRWDAQYEKTTTAFNALMAYTDQKREGVS